ncbi:hypothetical protein KC866_00025 [Patescibacteria group bacterium]|nr:hypothetical protein [Patescibacteria group bacterium]
MSQKITTIEHYILFDIDSASIGGAVVRHSKNARGDLVESKELFSVRKPITNGEPYSFERFFEKTITTLTSVADEVHLQALLPISQVYVNVSTPWMSSQKRVVHHAQKKPYTFTQELANAMVVESTDQTHHHTSSAYHDHTVELIDNRVIDVYAHGYPVRNPIGKELTEVDVHILASVMSATTKQAFTETIQSVFHHEPVYLSNTFVNYQTTLELLPDTNNSIIVDMSGEVTDVLVVRNDHLDHIGSLPVGLHHMVRSLADQLHVPYAKARSLLKLSPIQHLDDGYVASLIPAYTTAFKVWFTAFFDLLDEYAKHGILSNTIVLKADAQYVAWIQEQLLSYDQLQEHMHAGARPEIITLFQAHDTTCFHDKELGVFDTLIEESA